MVSTINPLVKDQLLNKSDNILKSLKLISLIDSGDKLFIRDDSLIIHPYSTTRALNRWWYSYNRATSMDFITNLYEESAKTIRQLEGVNSRGKVRTRRKFLRKKQLIESAIKNAKTGLLHLMMTYRNDSNIQMGINNILVKTEVYN